MTTAAFLFFSCLLLADVPGGAVADTEDEPVTLYIAVDWDGEINWSVSAPKSRPRRNLLIKAITSTFGIGAEILDEGSDEDGWWISGSSRGLFKSSGTAITGAVPIDSLTKQFAKNGRFVSLVVWHASAPVSECNLPNYIESGDGNWCGYTMVAPGEGIPAQISLRFGYGLGDAAATLVAYVLIVLAPALFLWWRRKHVFKMGESDPAGAWFGFYRLTQLTVVAGTFAQALGFFVLPADEILGLLAPHWSQELVVACLLAGILASALLCNWVYHPASTRLRGTTLSLGESLRQTALQLAVPAIPFVGAAQAAGAITEELNARAALWMVGAAVATVLLLHYRWRIMGVRLESLTEGVLRDRMFDLVRKAGLNLKQAYILTPAARLRLANAAAANSRQVILTDYLVRHLTRREVDAIFAHEVIHLRRKHPEKRIRALLLGIVPIVAVPLLVSATLAGYEVQDARCWLAIPVLLVTTIFLSMLLFVRLMWRQEWQADTESIALNGDPEAFITGLVNLSRFSGMPLDWKAWRFLPMTHPSTLDRIRKIARDAGISTERLDTLLAAPKSGDAYYEIPESVLRPDAVFSTMLKNRVMLRNTLVVLALPALAAAAVVQVGTLAGIHGALLWGFCALGVVLGAGLNVIAASYLANPGWMRMARKLRAQLTKEKAMPNLDFAVFVTFAPGNGLELYDGFFNWDIGFLGVDGTRLYYLGEKTRFALPRGSIQEFSLGRPLPGWIPARGVVIRWDRTSGESGGAFCVRPGTFFSLFQLTRASRELMERIQASLRSETGEVSVASSVSAWGEPNFGEITGTPVHAVFTLPAVVRLALLQGLATATICALGSLAGLSWEAPTVLGAVVTSIAASVLYLWPMLRPRT